MQTLIPLTDRGPWSVTGARRTNDGPLDEVDIAVDRGSQASRFSIRTMRRPGTRLGPRGSVHGTVTDAAATASLAAGCLLLEVLPAGLQKHEALAALEQAEARAEALARNRDCWDVIALPLDDIDYALFTRRISEEPSRTPTSAGPPSPCGAAALFTKVRLNWRTSTRAPIRPAADRTWIVSGHLIARRQTPAAD